MDFRTRLRIVLLRADIKRAKIKYGIKILFLYLKRRLMWMRFIAKERILILYCRIGITLNPLKWSLIRVGLTLGLIEVK